MELSAAFGSPDWANKLVAEIKARKGKTILFIRLFKSDRLRINNLTLELFSDWKPAPRCRRLVLHRSLDVGVFGGLRQNIEKSRGHHEDKKAGLALASPAGFSLILAVVNYAMILRIRRTQLLSWLMFLVLRGFIPFLHRVGFAHVLALFGLAVPFGPFLVIDMSLIVDPNLAVSAASSWNSRRTRVAR